MVPLKMERKLCSRRHCVGLVVCCSSNNPWNYCDYRLLQYPVFIYVNFGRWLDPLVQGVPQHDKGIQPLIDNVAG